MVERLVESLKTVWENKVKPTYQQGFICSERHLQSIVFKEFKDEELIAWVEPKLTGTNINLIEGYAPDLLFTYKQEIIAVMELKYSPYYKVEPQNDLYQFQAFQKEKQDDNYTIYLKINPINGDWNTQELYKLSADLLIIYGVVAKNDSEALSEGIAQKFSDKNFLHLKLSV